MPTYDAIRTRIVPDVEYHQNVYAGKLDALIRDGDRLLDLGAGKRPHGGWTGSANEELGRRASLFVGCDLLLEPLAENPFLHLRVVSDAEHLPLDTSCFEVVSANMVLEHLAAPETVFREVHRVLAPGGRFVFVTAHLLHPFVLLAKRLVPAPGRRALARVMEGRAEDDVFPTLYRANTRKALVRLCRLSGFEIETLSVFFSYPMLRRPALGTWIESWAIRFLPSAASDRVGSNIFGCLRKP